MNAVMNRQKESFLASESSASSALNTPLAASMMRVDSKSRLRATPLRRTRHFGIICCGLLTTVVSNAQGVSVIPTVRVPGGFGDFGWMRSQPEYANDFYVFNDNEEQATAHWKDPKDPFGCASGGGNAAIRPWQCETPPRAGGVPTGSLKDGGFQSLTPEVKELIDEAISRIGAQLKAQGVVRLYYSSCAKGVSPNCTLDDDLGTGIFQTSQEVRKYIVQCLKRLGR
jgi:hypothetical protein